MRNNLLLTAAHCVQDDITGHLAENFVFERCYTGELSTEDFTFKTGALGKTVTAMGYPLNYFGGAQMIYINGTVTERADNWTIIGGKLADGSSGGAWVLEDGKTAVGLTSFGVNTFRGGIYMGSPKFDEEFDKLYQYVLTLL